MKQRIENILAVIFLILLGFLSMDLTAECGSVMDPVRQQIRMEMLIQ